MPEAGGESRAASEPRAASGEGLEDVLGYSKDYWDLVFDQLGRRVLFKVALVVLAAPRVPMLEGLLSGQAAEEQAHIRFEHLQNLQQAHSEIRLLGVTSFAILIGL